MSKRIKYPNGVIYIEGKLSSHEEDEFYRQGERDSGEIGLTR